MGDDAAGDGPGPARRRADRGRQGAPVRDPPAVLSGRSERGLSARIAAELGVSEEAARAAAHRLRLRFRADPGGDRPDPGRPRRRRGGDPVAVHRPARKESRTPVTETLQTNFPRNSSQNGPLRPFLGIVLSRAIGSIGMNLRVKRSRLSSEAGGLHPGNPRRRSISEGVRPTARAGRSPWWPQTSTTGGARK